MYSGFVNARVLHEELYTHRILHLFTALFDEDFSPLIRMHCSHVGYLLLETMFD